MSSDPGTLVRWVGPAGGLMMDIRGSGAGFGISDIRLDANSTAAGGLRVSSVRNSTFSGFTIQNFTSYGLLLRNQTGPVGAVHYSSSNHFERFYITTGQHTGEFYGIHIQGDYPDGGDWFRNTFVNGVVQVPKSEDATSSAAYFEYLDSNTFIEVDLNMTSTYTGTGYAFLLDGRNNNGYPQNNFFYGCSINKTGDLEGPGQSVKIHFITLRLQMVKLSLRIQNCAG